MKKWITTLLAAVALLTVGGCGSETGQASVSEPASSSDAASQPETTQPPATVSADTSEAGSSRILIAYFTWADNTVVEDPSAVDVDASTSASVLAPGNAAKIASWIQQEVGGDLFSIVVTEPYSSDYDKCLDRAADEKADDARPTLSNNNLTSVNGTAPAATPAA